MIFILRVTQTLALVLCVAGTSAQDNSSAVVNGKSGITLPAPPVAKMESVVDEYKSVGSPTPVKVADNYRWLEDAQSPDTRAFISEENAYTQKYLDQLKTLPRVRDQISALLRVDFTGIPQQRGDRFFFLKRLASENQSSIYMRTGCMARMSD